MSHRISLSLAPYDLKNRDLPFVQRYIHDKHYASQHVRLNALRRALDHLLPNDKYVGDYTVNYYGATDVVQPTQETSATENFDILYKGTKVMSIHLMKSTARHSTSIVAAGASTTFARSMELLDNDFKFMTGTDSNRRPGYDMRGFYSHMRPVIRDIASPCQHIWTCIHEGVEQSLDYCFIFPEGKVGEESEGRMTYITVKLYNVAGINMTEEVANSYGVVGVEHVARFGAKDKQETAQHESQLVTEGTQA